MFGKKPKEDINLQELPKIGVTTIPKEFYGGANPVIKFKTVETNLNPAPAQPIKKVEMTKQNTVEKTAAAVGNRKIFILVGVGLFGLFVLGAGFYYWQISQPPKQKQPQTNPLVNNPPQNTAPVVIPTTTTPVVEVPTTTPEVVVPTTTVSMKGGLLEFPSILLGNSADQDHDGLLDTEEELFNTDPAKPDTDGDGYDDSMEVDNLYSPTVFAPARLLDTSAVKEFTNPLFGYKIYYPSSWAVANVDPEYRDMLFSTITGENIEVRVFDKENNQSFEEWFAIWAPEERLGSLMDFKTVFGGTARERNDKLVYYFSDDKHYYVIVYHLTGSSVVNYRNVINMMARSFRTSAETNAVLKNQEIITPDQSATSATSTP